MIKELIPFVEKILTDHPETRGDGYGLFLNKVTDILFSDGRVDFTQFSVESYTRARRKVFETNPELDDRTSKTTTAENVVKNEMGG